MNSLLVLVSGLLILMIVDYIIRNVRNRFLSIAGVDSDLTLADRLFAQVMDLHINRVKAQLVPLLIL